MKDRFSVGLEGMKFHAFHGFYEEEQIVGRTFIVDVKLQVFSTLDGEDNISDTFNYETIYEIVQKEMTTTQKLIETVGFRIKEELISRSKHPIEGTIRIAKESPLMAGEVGRSVIEVYF